MVKIMIIPSRNIFLATLFAALIFPILLSACQRDNESKPRNSMSELPPRLQAIFEKTRTICFGRFLIKIPATATVAYGSSDIEGPIDFYEGKANELAEHLTKRLGEVEEEREFFFRDAIKDFPLFGKVIDGAIPGQKIVFGSKDRVGYAIESYIPVGKDLFVHSLDSVLPEYDEVPMFNRVASHLRARAEDEIPAEPGVCIEGGFIPLAEEHEWVRIGIRLKEFPDVHLSISAHKNLEYLPEESNPKLLRDRAKKFAEAAGLGAVFARTKTLRQQARQLNTWAGEEMALRTPAYKDNKSVHEFRFHSLGAVHDPLRPELDIRLDTGVTDNIKAGMDPSLSDEEALRLWDKLITTIRVRQPSDATPTKTATPRAPLASLARTGETCPQTGWWECPENENSEGNKRRLLKAGEPMPHALLIDKSGLWQKLTGNRPVRQIATAWKLVAYDADTVAPEDIENDHA
jgi:hypothetical protein